MACLESSGNGSAGPLAVGGSGGKASKHQAASPSPSLTYHAKNVLIWGLSKIIRLVDGSSRQRYGWCVHSYSFRAGWPHSSTTAGVSTWLAPEEGCGPVV